MATVLKSVYSSRTLYIGQNANDAPFFEISDPGAGAGRMYLNVDRDAFITAVQSELGLRLVDKNATVISGTASPFADWEMDLLNYSGKEKAYNDVLRAIEAWKKTPAVDPMVERLADALLDAGSAKNLGEATKVATTLVAAGWGKD